MGTQSINDRNADTLYKKSMKSLKKYSEKEYLNKYYLIGDKQDRDEINYNILLVETLCTDNCELIDFMERKFKGELYIQNRKGRTIEKIIIEGNCNGYIPSDQDAECCDWREIEW